MKCWIPLISKNGSTYPSADMKTVCVIVFTSRAKLIPLPSLLNCRYTLASVIGLIGAMLSAFTIAAVYIPSFVSSVIKLRSGFSPSLKGNSQTFLCYRKSPDSAAILWGSAFWGVLFSAGICFLFFGGIAFVCAYSVRYHVLKVCCKRFHPSPTS